MDAFARIGLAPLIDGRAGQPPPGHPAKAGEGVERHTRPDDLGPGRPRLFGLAKPPEQEVSDGVPLAAGPRPQQADGILELVIAGRRKAQIVNDADDFVICCRAGADEAMATMRTTMSKLKLTVNETKTRVCMIPVETFDFLGYTFGRRYNYRTGAAYLAASPAKEKIARLCGAIREQTDRRWLLLDEEAMVGRPNGKLRGWANDFDLGMVSQPMMR